MAINLIVITFLRSIAGHIVWAWVLTITAAAVIAALSYGIVLLFEKALGYA